MALTATIRIDDPVSARLREIAAQIKNPGALYKEAGHRLTEDLRTHFSELEQQQAPQHGSRSTHFWLDVRNATQNPVADPEGVTVTIAHAAFAQKYFGGTISAKKANWLTIPIDPAAHGRRVSIFEAETGHKLFRPKGTRILAYSENAKLVPVYALAKSVTQDADPQALPPLEELEAAVLETATKHIKEIAEI